MGPKQVMEWAEKKINGGVALTEEDSVDAPVLSCLVFRTVNADESSGNQWDPNK